jgi:hypothetical protein
MPPQSTFAMERSLRYPTAAPTIICLTCGDTMNHFLTISKLGVRPERLVFVCPSCKGIGSREVKWMT